MMSFPGASRRQPDRLAGRVADRGSRIATGMSALDIGVEPGYGGGISDTSWAHPHRKTVYDGS
jgi:hypothetical protein